MKTKAILIIVLLMVTLSSYSQSSYYYSNPDLFKGEAIVFKSEYTSPMELLEGAITFTPDKSDIVLAETTLTSRFNVDINWTKKIKNTKKKYWKYNRQYIGFRDIHGNKHILINLLNFKCKKKAKRKFEGWRKSFFIAFGEYYEKNIIRLIVNLDAEKLSLY